MPSLLGRSFVSLVLIGILLITLFLTSRSVFREGLMSGHDAYAHATYAKLFSHALLEGQFPVRWVEHAWIGFGQPLFNVYQVGFNYFFSIINFFSPDFLLSLKLSVFLLWWIGAGFIFLFTKKYGLLPASLSCIVYIFSPYLILDIFIRASYPEFMALSFMPGVFWSFDKILTRPKAYFIAVVALILAVVVFSHLPTLVIFSPLILGYILLLVVTKKATRKGGIFVMLGGMLGLGIASFYLLPAVFQLDLISLQKLQTGMFEFRKNFVDLQNLATFIWGYNAEWWGWAFSSGLLIGVASWTVLIGSVALSFKKSVYSLDNKLSIMFWLGVVLYCFFFMTPASFWLWENIRTLHFLQFPWRFFMVIPIATAVLAALTLKGVGPGGVKLLIVLLVFLMNLIFTAPFLAPEDFMQQKFWNLPFNEWRIDPKARELAFHEPAYSPANTDQVSDTDEFGKIWNIPSGQDILVHERELKNTNKEFTIETANETLFLVYVPYFPGWNAFIDGEAVNIGLVHPYNFMAVKVPEGTHTVRLTFGNLPLTELANKLSMYSWVVSSLVLFSPILLLIVNFVTRIYGAAGRFKGFRSTIDYS